MNQRTDKEFWHILEYKNILEDKYFEDQGNR